MTAAEPTELGLPRFAVRNILADEVYDILREMLISRRIEPGSRVNLDHLARQLHVSNTPVRQALARLEAEGLVTREPHRGFTASPMLDLRTIHEQYEVRLMMEPLSAAKAARLPSSDAAEALLEICTSAENIDAEAGPEAIALMNTHDIDFHTGISNAGGNRLVTEILQQTLTRMSSYTLYQVHDVWEHTWREHRAVARAIADGDAAAAEAAMRTHLQGGLRRARNAFS